MPKYIFGQKRKYFGNFHNRSIFLILFLCEQKWPATDCHICMNFSNFCRRRSRALSRANIKHDVGRGSRTASRGDILLNVNEKRSDKTRQVAKSHKTPRDVSPDHRFVSPRERKVRDVRLPVSESPKSSRERPEIDHHHELRPPTPQVRIIRSSTESLMVSWQFWF